MISEATISKVRNISIEEVLKPYVSLARRGTSLVGLCPFHSERTPSFTVSPKKGLYHCFGCNRGGDAISFIMEKENLSFMDAVVFIAKRHGIEVEYVEEEQSDDKIVEARHRESLLIALEHIQKFFFDILRQDTPESRQARDYVYGRWPEETCAIAGIGYAPQNGGLFADYCRKAAMSEDALFELGFLKRNEDGGAYAMFRQRIMIPVRDRWGRVTAYTARYIGTNREAPKYINSATSPIYSKGETLFGIDRASRVRDADYFIAVEGASDVLRMQSVGYDNTVAALGTAWTDSQFTLLKKFTNSLCFIPDSDIAEGKTYGPGFKAVMANGAAAIRKGFHVTVRELPFAKSPISEEELHALYPGGIPDDAVREKPVKNDADSYIRSNNVLNSSRKSTASLSCGARPSCRPVAKPARKKTALPRWTRGSVTPNSCAVSGFLSVTTVITPLPTTTGNL